MFVTNPCYFRIVNISLYLCENKNHEKNINIYWIIIHYSKPVFTGKTERKVLSNGVW